MAAGNIYMYLSATSKGLFCFSRSSKGGDLPSSFAPWKVFGVVRHDQPPPQGLSRYAIESGIEANGYQLWRQKRKSQSKSI